MMRFRVFICVCLLLLSCGSTHVIAFPSRYALFWLAGHLNTSSDYEKAFHQWAAQNRTDYIMAADTYQLGQDGSLEYYEGGQVAEQHGFTTLAKMGLATQAIFYQFSVEGIATMVANPQPMIDTLIKRAIQYNIGGYHLYYEPGEPLPHHLISPPKMNQSLATSYSDFIIQLGAAFVPYNLTLTVGFMGCPSWNGLTCQSLTSMNNILGAQTWDTLGVNDIPSYIEFAQNDQQLLGSNYCPGLFAYYFGQSGWATITQYLAQHNVTQLATYPANYWDQSQQPQWFFDGINAFLDA